MGLGGRRCSSWWGLEVDAAVPYVASFPCPALVCDAGLGTGVQDKEEEKEEEWEGEGRS